MDNILYVCDQKACGDRCSYPICRYTTDIKHAKNFTLGVPDEENPIYIEQEEAE